jgi:hypothetical protein
MIQGTEFQGTEFQGTEFQGTEIPAIARESLDSWSAAHLRSDWTQARGWFGQWGRQRAYLCDWRSHWTQAGHWLGQWGYHWTQAGQWSSHWTHLGQWKGHWAQGRHWSGDAFVCHVITSFPWFVRSGGVTGRVNVACVVHQTGFEPASLGLQTQVFRYRWTKLVRWHVGAERYRALVPTAALAHARFESSSQLALPFKILVREGVILLIFLTDVNRQVVGYREIGGGPH